MWILFALLSAITASLVAIFGKVGLKDVDPTLATTLRGIVMALMLIVFTFATGKFKDFDPSKLAGREWLFISLAAFAGATSWLFYFLALKDGDAGKVAAIDRTSIVFILILAAIFIGERLTTTSIAGGVLVMLGAILIAFA
jgi:transporter family protein